MLEEYIGNLLKVKWSIMSLNTYRDDLVLFLGCSKIVAKSERGIYDFYSYKLIVLGKVVTFHSSEHFHVWFEVLE